MLGKYLKKYRLENNLTQKEIAKRLHTSQNYYCLIETGARKPGIAMIDKLSKLTGVKPSFLRSLL